MSLDIHRAVQTAQLVVTALEKQPEMLALELPRLAGNMAGCNGQKCVSARYWRGQTADGPCVQAQGMRLNRSCQHPGRCKPYQL